MEAAKTSETFLVIDQDEQALIVFPNREFVLYHDASQKEVKSTRSAGESVMRVPLGQTHSHTWLQTILPEANLEACAKVGSL